MSDITKALIKFQLECPAIIKDKTAEVVSKRTGGKFSYGYADLAGIMTAVRPVLSNCSLFLSQSFDVNGSTYLVTKVLHESGEAIESKIALPIDGLSPQEAGSAITYYRRYSIMAILGIAAEDDDAEAAQNAGATHGKDPVGAIAAEKYLNDPAFAPFLKDTPKGKCWKVTSIQGAMRAFVHDLEGIADKDELSGFLADNKTALDACAIALPNWYYGKQGSDVPGIEKRIGDKKRDLQQDPARYMRA